MSDTQKKRCSLVGPVYADTISTHPIYTGSCLYLGRKSGCKPPIKATTTPNGTRGIPLTGSYNNPGFSLNRAYRMSHAVRYNKTKTKIATVSVNPFKKHAGSPSGSGRPHSNTLIN